MLQNHCIGRCPQIAAQGRGVRRPGSYKQEGACLHEPAPCCGTVLQLLSLSRETSAPENVSAKSGCTTHQPAHRSQHFTHAALTHFLHHFLHGIVLS